MLALRFTFPGIIDEPGSFSGMCISPIPDRGPEANIRISFAILFKDTVVSRHHGFHNGIVSKSLKFIRCGCKGSPVNCDIYLATVTSYPEVYLNCAYLQCHLELFQINAMYFVKLDSIA
jgi:hypothetical protein